MQQLVPRRVHSLKKTQSGWPGHLEGRAGASLLQQASSSWSGHSRCLGSFQPEISGVLKVEAFPCGPSG